MFLYVLLKNDDCFLQDHADIFSGSDAIVMNGRKVEIEASTLPVCYSLNACADYDPINSYIQDDICDFGDNNDISFHLERSLALDTNKKSALKFTKFAKRIEIKRLKENVETSIRHRNCPLGRFELLANVIVLEEGLKERIQKDLKQESPVGSKINVKIGKGGYLGAYMGMKRIGKMGRRQLQKYFYEKQRFSQFEQNQYIENPWSNPKPNFF